MKIQYCTGVLGSDGSRAWADADGRANDFIEKAAAGVGIDSVMQILAQGKIARINDGDWWSGIRDFDSVEAVRLQTLARAERDRLAAREQHAKTSEQFLAETGSDWYDQ